MNGGGKGLEVKRRREVVRVKRRRVGVKRMEGRGWG